MNNLNSKYQILLIILICSALQAINFREGDGIFPYYLWFSGGLGALTTEESGMTSVYASVNFSKDAHVLKLRGITAGSIQGTPEDDGVNEIGLLYGYRHSFGNVSLSYLAGIGLTSGKYKGEIDKDFTAYTKHEMIKYETFGFPLEVQIDMNALRPFGLSLSVFGDLNTEKSFIGFSTNILIGRLP